MIIFKKLLYKPVQLLNKPLNYLKNSKSKEQVGVEKLQSKLFINV
jgi:hypothetical protein